jgi:hypothetical protein
MVAPGKRLVIEATDGPTWLLSWDNAVSTSSDERVSFTIAIPSHAGLTVTQAQVYALKRAQDLLGLVIAEAETRLPR